jgi:hypothetical protein
MNCKELAKEILNEINTASGAKNQKAAEAVLARRLRTMFEIGPRGGDDIVIAVYMDCGVPKGVYVNKKDMLEARIVILDDPSILDDDKLDTAKFYDDRVVMGILKPELHHDARSLVELVD